jgi:pseudaminic acid biosynthesis-associated methylase
VSKPESADAVVTAQAETAQTDVWRGEFGRAYTDRNVRSVDVLNTQWQARYGVSRQEINQLFLSGVPKEARFLEVGCNVGNQLLMLREMGYSNLSGVELQPYAVEIATSRVEGASIRQGSALSLPHADDAFDLVFTTEVLIHIAPQDIPRVLDEIHRCAKTYVWGTEYYAPSITEVNYRGHGSLLWKMDYARQYLERFADLELVLEKHLSYLENDNVDTVFLLRKK